MEMRHKGSLGVFFACVIQTALLYAYPINPSRMIIIHLITAGMYISGYYIGAKELTDKACELIREAINK